MQYFRSRVVSDIRKENSSSCIMALDRVLILLDQAHQLFMADHPISAILRELEAVQSSAVVSKELKWCPLYLVADSPFGWLYLNYFLDNKLNQPKSASMHPITTSLDAKELKLLNEYYMDMYQRVNSLCLSKKCNSYLQSIVKVSEAIIQELNSAQPRADYLLAWCANIRKYIAQAYFQYDAIDLLNRIIPRTNHSLALLQTHVFDENNLDELSKKQNMLITYMRRESKLESACPILYFEMFSKFRNISDETPQRQLVSLINMHHGLFRILGDYYYQIHDLSKCSIPSEIYEIPFQFHQELYKKISELTPN